MEFSKQSDETLIAFIFTTREKIRENRDDKEFVVQQVKLIGQATDVLEGRGNRYWWRR